MKKYSDRGKIDKSWGFEIVWASNELYSAKIMVFPKAGNKTALMIHKNRKKSWFVNGGKFKITFTDVLTGSQKEQVLEEGKTVDIADMSPHMLEALTDNSMIFEVGTADELEDQFKLSPDADQTQISTQE